MGAYGLLKSMAFPSGRQLLQRFARNFFFGNSKTRSGSELVQRCLLFYKSPRVVVDMFIFSSADAKSLDILHSPICVAVPLRLPHKR